MVVGHVQRYSDMLLMFLLRAHRPGKFRETVTIGAETDGKEGKVYIQFPMGEV